MVADSCNYSACRPLRGAQQKVTITVTMATMSVRLSLCCRRCTRPAVDMRSADCARMWSPPLSRSYVNIFQKYSFELFSRALELNKNIIYGFLSLFSFKVINCCFWCSIYLRMLLKIVVDPDVLIVFIKIECFETIKYIYLREMQDTGVLNTYWRKVLNVSTSCFWQKNILKVFDFQSLFLICATFFR